MRKKINETELAGINLNGKYKLAIWTDKADFAGADDDIADFGKLLELRTFDRTGEERYYRSYVGEDFFIREKKDDQSDAGSDGYFDEEQYLDIDASKTGTRDDNIVFATGGGSYHLPVPSAKKLKIRYYYRFDSDGVAYVYDKRLVDFI